MKLSEQLKNCEDNKSRIKFMADFLETSNARLIERVFVMLRAAHVEETSSNIIDLYEFLERQDGKTFLANCFRCEESFEATKENYVGSPGFLCGECDE